MALPVVEDYNQMPSINVNLTLLKATVKFQIGGMGRGEWVRFRLGWVVVGLGL